MTIAVYVIAPLAVVIVMAAATIAVVSIALRGTPPQERARILYAVAAVIRAARYPRSGRIHRGG